jgi:ribosomal-protein-alanine N-acetyltransferase
MTAPVTKASTLVIESLLERRLDALALAQCIAIDATVFPFPSMLFERAAIDPAAHVWVAREDADGRVIGVLGAYARQGLLHVHGLAVDPDHRRGGAGRGLLRAAIDGARRIGARALHLQVSTTNTAAIALYESEGFEAVRVRRAYYAAGVYRGSGDALEMIRTVSKSV